jgi:hypothetical protein
VAGHDLRLSQSHYPVDFTASPVRCGDGGRNRHANWNQRPLNRSKTKLVRQKTLRWHHLV